MDQTPGRLLRMEALEIGLELSAVAAERVDVLVDEYMVLGCFSANARGADERETAQPTVLGRYWAPALERWTTTPRGGKTRPRR